VRIAFLSRVLPRFGSPSRRSATRAATALVALCSSATFAIADVHTFACKDGFTGTLCDAGAGSQCAGNNNPDDNLHITGTTTSSIIKFHFIYTGSVGSSTTVQVNGQGTTPDPTNTNPLTVSDVSPTGDMSGTGAAGQSNYMAKITSMPSRGTIHSVSYMVSCTAPSLSLTKSANPTTFTAANQLITYTYMVKNTGNVDISNITVTDNRISGSISCSPSTLSPGASATCIAVYTTTTADVTAGSIVNEATATGNDPTNNPVTSNKATATVTFINNKASLSLKKMASPTTFTGANQTITYTYTVTNNGNAPISSISVADNKLGSVSCSPTTLTNPGDMATCTATYTTTSADVSAGSIINVATATGKDPNNIPVTSPPATATVMFVAQPSLQLAKTANPATYTSPGQAITYTYTVTNNGNVPIINTSVTDNKIGTFPCGPSPLIPGGVAVCTAVYTITSADVTAGSVTNVASASGKDPSNNTVTSNTATVTIKRNDDFIRDRTQQVIQNFLYRRADQLLSNEPDRNRLIRRLPGVLWGDSNTQTGQGGSTFTVSGGDGGGPTHIAFATSFSQMMADARAARQKKAQEQNDQMMGLGVAPHSSLKDEPLPVWNSGFDLWVEGHYSHFDDDQGKGDRSGHLGVMYVGADYLVTPGLLIGALVQFDWMTDTSNVQQTSADGHGWMAGPYVSARLSENVFFDARAAWGTSDNTVNPLGFFVDNFDTDRWLARANLTGNWNYGNWRFTPSVSVAHIEEEQHAYLDAIGIAIPGQSVALGRVTFGPEVGYRFFASDGSIIEPMASIQGLWDFEKPDVLTIGDQIVSPDTFRGKVEAGVMFSMPVGATVRATANYDGIGSSDFRAYGGQLWVNLPLH
jgi:uncharacterized repeat protein (TIGR01451 family)